MSVTEPRSGLGLVHSWGLGTNNWDTEMDANLKKLGLFGVHCCVLDKDLTTPPGSPSNGDAYIVAATATGAWTGHEKHIAIWDTSLTTPAWTFGTPREGWLCYVTDEAVLYVYHSAAWVTGGTEANTIENGKTGATTAAGARTNLGLGTTEQNTLLYSGSKAAVSITLKAFASLSNGQTVVTVTPLLATVSFTINAALVGATTVAEVTAALATSINTANTTAYVWTANSTGMTGAAKDYGSAFNVAPSGTAAASGAITSWGSNPIADDAFGGMTENKDVKKFLTDDACVTLGGEARDYEIDFLDFEASSLGTSGQPLHCRLATGTMSTSPAHSCIRVVNSAAYITSPIYYPWPTLNPSHTAFRWAVRAKHKISTSGFHGIYADGPWQIGFGSWGGGAADPTHLYIASHSGANLVADYTPDASVLIADLGVNDEKMHVYEWESPGDGTIRWRFDYGPWSSYITKADTATARAYLNHLNTDNPCDSQVDWVFLAVRRLLT